MLLDELAGVQGAPLTATSRSPLQSCCWHTSPKATLGADCAEFASRCASLMCSTGCLKMTTLWCRLWICPKHEKAASVDLIKDRKDGLVDVTKCQKGGFSRWCQLSYDVARCTFERLHLQCILCGRLHLQCFLCGSTGREGVPLGAGTAPGRLLCGSLQVPPQLSVLP